MNSANQGNSWKVFSQTKITCPICENKMLTHQGSDTKTIYCDDCGLIIRFPIKITEQIKKWLGGD